MDWDGYFSLYDDVTLTSYEFTRKDRELLTSALSFIWGAENWSTGDYDTIDAKLSELSFRLSQDGIVGHLHHEAQVVTTIDQASIEITDLDDLPDGDVIFSISMKGSVVAVYDDLLIEVNGLAGSSYRVQSNQYRDASFSQVIGTVAAINIHDFLDKGDNASYFRSVAEIAFPQPRDTSLDLMAIWSGARYRATNWGSCRIWGAASLHTIKFIGAADDIKAGALIDIYTRRTS